MNGLHVTFGGKCTSGQTVETRSAKSRRKKNLAKVGANHANSSKNAFSVFSKSENVQMVETRAAITKEGEKGDSIEYSQRSSYAPTRVFTSTPESQSIPSIFFATHYET